MLSTNYNAESCSIQDSVQGLWALMDCNNFYASCERLFRPDLMGRPIVVLSNNDGCIVARSAEAKALGIPMGEPEFKARAFLKKHNVAVFSSNYALYGDMSRRVMEVTEASIPYVEQYSIDEAFLRFTKALECNALEAARALRERIYRYTGIAVSIGLGPTRTLAKLANYLAKKGDGIYVFPKDRQEQDALLSAVPVNAIWGIGRRQTTTLTKYNIHSAKALRDLDAVWLRQKLTVTGVRTAMELRGIPCIDEDTSPSCAIRHTLVSSRSFGQRIFLQTHLAEALTSFAVKAGARLRKEALLAQGIAVHIRSSKHPYGEKQGQGKGDYIYNKTLSLKFPFPTADTQMMIKASMQGLDALFKEGVAYAKAGIMLFDLSAASKQQASLLDLMDPTKEAAQKKSHELMRTLDAVNARHGRHALRYAGEGLDAHAPWRMRQQYRSPRFTTSWNELPTVR